MFHIFKESFLVLKKIYLKKFSLRLISCILSLVIYLFAAFEESGMLESDEVLLVYFYDLFYQTYSKDMNQFINYHCAPGKGRGFSHKEDRIKMKQK